MESSGFSEYHDALEVYAHENDGTYGGSPTQYHDALEIYAHEKDNQADASPKQNHDALEVYAHENADQIKAPQTAPSMPKVFQTAQHAQRNTLTESLNVVVSSEMTPREASKAESTTTRSSPDQSKPRSVPRHESTASSHNVEQRPPPRRRRMSASLLNIVSGDEASGSADGKANNATAEINARHMNSRGRRLSASMLDIARDVKGDDFQGKETKLPGDDVVQIVEVDSTDSNHDDDQSLDDLVDIVEVDSNDTNNDNDQSLHLSPRVESPRQTPETSEMAPAERGSHVSSPQLTSKTFEVKPVVSLAAAVSNSKVAPEDRWKLFSHLPGYKGIDVNGKHLPVLFPTPTALRNKQR